MILLTASIPKLRELRFSTRQLGVSLMNSLILLEKYLFNLELDEPVEDFSIVIDDMKYNYTCELYRGKYYIVTC